MNRKQIIRIPRSKYEQMIEKTRQMLMNNFINVVKLV